MNNTTYQESRGLDDLLFFLIFGSPGSPLRQTLQRAIGMLVRKRCHRMGRSYFPSIRYAIVEHLRVLLLWLTHPSSKGVVQPDLSKAF